jgi:hypothetical protein
MEDILLGKGCGAIGVFFENTGTMAYVTLEETNSF